MNTAQVTVPLPIVPGHVYTGEYRVPDLGDTILRNGAYPVTKRHVFPEFILKKIECPVPDGVLNSGWIAMDDDELWYWFETEPTFDDGKWIGVGSRGLNVLLNIDWPTIPPEQSLFKV